MPFSCTAPRFDLCNLSSEIASLSIEALEEVNRDLYGLEEPSVESESSCALALDRLNDALSCIPEKTEFMRASELCPDYSNSQEFRLMFLRSERFNADVSNFVEVQCSF